MVYWEPLKGKPTKGRQENCGVDAKHGGHECEGCDQGEGCRQHGGGGVHTRVEKRRQALLEDDVQPDMHEGLQEGRAARLSPLVTLAALAG
eukprot:6468247-Amphidinium_carterae.1